MAAAHLAGRLFLSLVLVATLVGTLGAPVSAQGSNASVEIHLRSCPTGYNANNYYEDCHDDPISDVTFELGGLRDTTGADGNVLFFDLRGGTYTITDSIPGAFAEHTVFCSYGEQGEQTASFTHVQGGIRLDVPNGAEIVCDWYITPYNLRGASPAGDDGGDIGALYGSPPGASVIIHSRLCPPGYTGTEPFETCHDNPRPGITLTLANLSATTDQDGNTLFYQLNPGAWQIQEEAQGEFWFYSVYCSLLSDISQSVDISYVPRGFEVTVPEDTDIVCDWYSVPEAIPGGGVGEDEAGRLTIHAAQCPPGYDGESFFEDCHGNRLGGIAFDVFGPEGLLRLGETTNPQGVLVIDGIEVGGTVSVLQVFEEAPTTAVFVVYCSDEQSERVPFTYQERPERGGIRINIFRGDSVLCDWYNIPPAS